MKEKIIAKAADRVISKNVNSACFFFIHQPKLPQGALSKYKK